MPLRDHFRPPVSKQASWEGFHAMWPTCIVQQLRVQLPPGYVAEPRVHLGTLMEILVGHPDPTMAADGPPTYAASCRWVTRGPRARLEAWSHALAVGEPLPTLPLWLGADRVVPLPLEETYEKACHYLWIP